MNLHDTLLFYRLRRGDHAAFEAVVAEHYPSVYKQVWYLCNGNAEIAADLTQETFVEAWRCLPSFAGRSSLRTWLFTIVVRSWHRHRRRSGNTEQDILLEAGDQERLPDLSPSPSNQTEINLSAESVCCALRKIPSLSREVVVLYYLDQLKYREIADILDIPLGTVKSRLHTALKQLRIHLEPEGEDDERF